MQVGAMPGGQSGCRLQLQLLSLGRSTPHKQCVFGEGRGGARPNPRAFLITGWGSGDPRATCLQQLPRLGPPCWRVPAGSWEGRSCGFSPMPGLPWQFPPQGPQTQATAPGSPGRVQTNPRDQDVGPGRQGHWVSLQSDNSRCRGLLDPARPRRHAWELPPTAGDKQAPRGSAACRGCTEARLTAGAPWLQLVVLPSRLPSLTCVQLSAAEASCSGSQQLLHPGEVDQAPSAADTRGPDRQAHQPLQLGAGTQGCGRAGTLVSSLPSMAPSHSTLPHAAAATSSRRMRRGGEGPVLRQVMLLSASGAPGTAGTCSPAPGVWEAELTVGGCPVHTPPHLSCVRACLPALCVHTSMCTCDVHTLCRVFGTRGPNVEQGLAARVVFLSSGARALNQACTSTCVLWARRVHRTWV